ncbi:hypothetical protein EVU91_05470 [Macrococcoides bohemicum]|uniref:hypothetical protein n=1 Tax=Macrococcoides bohemicum TaxID=1903056 RepID=UPI00105A9DB1|nr:hypothetical protein [Macrococcus bohemicus]TDL38355.1 hypothetical protein EVU91_05470 [Macrococcus bohemicus]
MKSIDIVINKLPKDLQQIVADCDANEVMGYFMEEEADTELAYLVSNIATHMDTVEAHTMGQLLFDIAVNWLDQSYYLAAFHGFRILELQEFKDVASMKAFIGNAEHPDYDIIPNALFRFVAEKIKAIEPNYKLQIPDNVHEIELPDILDKKVMKAMKGKTYGFKDAKFGITRKEFEAIFGEPTEALINMGEKYVTALYYRSRYNNTIISPFFKGAKDMDEQDYVFTDIKYYYEMHENISMKAFRKVWGKPEQKGIALGNKSYRYGNVNVSFDKDWEGKFYVKQVWFGNDESAQKERERFDFEVH